MRNQSMNLDAVPFNFIADIDTSIFAVLARMNFPQWSKICFPRSFNHTEHFAILTNVVQVPVVNTSILTNWSALAHQLVQLESITIIIASRILYALMPFECNAFNRSPVFVFFI